MMEIGAVTTARASNVNVTVALCLLCAVLEGFDIQAMGVAAPRLLPEFGLSPSQMGWVFSVSNIGLVIGAAFGGWLADRVGRKPVFIVAVATFGVFTLGYGRFGPTEARLMLIGLNTALVLGVIGNGLLDIVGVGLAIAMIAALIGRAARNLRQLAALEPAS